jgi:hypothetical protein
VRTAVQLGLVALLGAAAVGAVTTAATASGPDPKQLILQQRSLPPGFELSSTSTLGVAAATRSGATPRQWRSWGFIGGYSAAYDVRPDGLGPFGSWMSVAYINTTANVFSTAKGAHGALVAVEATCKRTGRRIALGDEAQLCTESWGYGGNAPPGVTGVTYVVRWRLGRMLGLAAASGDKGSMDVARALELARAQLRLMRGDRNVVVRLPDQLESLVRRVVVVADAFEAVGIPLTSDQTVTSVNGVVEPALVVHLRDSGLPAFDYGVDVYIAPDPATFDQDDWSRALAVWSRLQLPVVRLGTVLVVVTPPSVGTPTALPAPVARAVAVLETKLP